MLGTLRKQSRSVIIYVLFGIIIIVFVFTFNMNGQDSGCMGMGGSSNTTNSLVTVGDSELDVSDLHMGLKLSVDAPAPGKKMTAQSMRDEMLYRTTRFARLGSEDRFRPYNPDPSKISMIKARKVVDDLEETYLVSEEARALGLRAVPEEIRERIVADFTDPSSGKFLKKSYENYVRFGLRTSLARFEEFVGREILREKMIGLVASGAHVSDAEAKYMAERRKTGKSYEYLEIDPTVLAGAITPTEEEISAFLASNLDEAKAYFAAHQDEYRIPAGFDFHVLKFGGAAKSILGMFEDPEQRKNLLASRADAKVRAEKALAVLEGLSGDAETAAIEGLAKEASDDNRTRETAGRTTSPLGAPAVASLYDKEVADALSNMKVGERSGIIEGDRGFYIIRLEGQSPAVEPQFEGVMGAIAKKIIGNKFANDRLASVSADALARVQAKPKTPLAEILVEINAPFAPENPVRIGETGQVSSMPDDLSGMIEWSPTAIPGLGDSKELAANLAGLTPDSPVLGQLMTLDGSEAKYVLRLKGVSSGADVSEEDIAKALEDLLLVKRRAVYRDWYQELRTKAAADGKLVENELLDQIVQDEVKARDEAIENPKGSDKPATPADKPLEG